MVFYKDKIPYFSTILKVNNLFPHWSAMPALIQGKCLYNNSYCWNWVPQISPKKGKIWVYCLLWYGRPPHKASAFSSEQSKARSYWELDVWSKAALSLWRLDYDWVNIMIVQNWRKTKRRILRQGFQRILGCKLLMLSI